MMMMMVLIMMMIQGMKIHVSETAKLLLEKKGFSLEKRGQIQVKVSQCLSPRISNFTLKQKTIFFLLLQGKGMMDTYWVTDYTGPDPSTVIDSVGPRRQVTSSLDGRLSSIASHSDIQRSHQSMRSTMNGASPSIAILEDDEDEPVKQDDPEERYAHMAQVNISTRSQVSQKREPIATATVTESASPNGPASCTSGTCCVQ